MIGPLQGSTRQGERRVPRHGHRRRRQRLRVLGVAQYVEDSTPPETTITSGPTDTTKARKPTFQFKSSETKSTFECRYDSDPFGPCSGAGKDTPATNLSLGSHTFYVRATDPAKNTDPTPAQRTFTVVR